MQLRISSVWTLFPQAGQRDIWAKIGTVPLKSGQLTFRMSDTSDLYDKSFKVIGHLTNLSHAKNELIFKMALTYINSSERFSLSTLQ